MMIRCRCFTFLTALIWFERVQLLPMSIPSSSRECERCHLSSGSKIGRERSSLLREWPDHLAVLSNIVCGLGRSQGTLRQIRLCCGTAIFPRMVEGDYRLGRCHNGNIWAFLIKNLNYSVAQTVAFQYKFSELDLQRVQHIRLVTGRGASGPSLKLLTRLN